MRIYHLHVWSRIYLYRYVILNQKILYHREHASCKYRFLFFRTVICLYQLIFSDTTIVSDLEKYNISQVEAGVRFKKKLYNLGLFVYGSYSKIPAFSISQALYDRIYYYPPVLNSTQSSISSLRKLYGYRIYFDTHIEKQFIYDVTMNISQRSGKDEIWPYPSFELF